MTYDTTKKKLVTPLSAIQYHYRRFREVCSPHFPKIIFMLYTVEILVRHIHALSGTSCSPFSKKLSRNHIWPRHVHGMPLRHTPNVFYSHVLRPKRRFAIVISLRTTFINKTFDVILLYRRFYDCSTGYNRHSMPICQLFAVTDRKARPDEVM